MPWEKKRGPRMEKRFPRRGKGSSGEEKVFGGSVPREGKRCLDASKREKVPQCLGRGKGASVPRYLGREKGASVPQEGKSCTK